MSKVENHVPGKHLLIDFWGASGLENIDKIEAAMRDAAATCNATVLDVNLHSFGYGQGVTGVAILAESHISIHTWPETSYAALDVFMCGDCDPSLSIPVFEKYFSPDKINISEHMRG